MLPLSDCKKYYDENPVLAGIDWQAGTMLCAGAAVCSCSVCVGAVVCSCRAVSERAPRGGAHLCRAAAQSSPAQRAPAAPCVAASAAQGPRVCQPAPPAAVKWRLCCIPCRQPGKAKGRVQRRLWLPPVCPWRRAGQGCPGAGGEGRGGGEHVAGASLAHASLRLLSSHQAQRCRTLESA